MIIPNIAWNSYTKALFVCYLPEILNLPGYPIFSLAKSSNAHSSLKDTFLPVSGPRSLLPDWTPSRFPSEVSAWVQTLDPPMMAAVEPWENDLISVFLFYKAGRQENLSHRTAWGLKEKVSASQCISHSVQFSSVAQSCPTLCDPMNRSTPGLAVHHQLPESTQTHVHRVDDAIQPSHPLSSPSPPALNLSQHQGLFQ